MAALVLGFPLIRMGIRRFPGILGAAKGQEALLAKNLRALREKYAAELFALGTAVLPTGLGTEGCRQVVAYFLGWLEGQDPKAERSHGHFDGPEQLKHSPPGTPWEWVDGSTYVEQLELLRAVIQARGRSEAVILEFASGLVPADERLPERPKGHSLPVDLMAVFYRDPRMSDWVYRRKIGKFSCRGHEGAGRAPEAI